MTDLRSLFFVRKCLVCGAVLTDGTVFCPKCRLEYEKLKRARCPRCGAPQSACRCAPPMLTGVRAVHLFAFDGALSRKLIYLLKRKDVRVLQNFFADELSSLLSPLCDGETAITYAPRAKKSVRLYGFDQAARIAKRVAKELDLPLVSLFRHKGSTLQKNLSATERKENAEGSYALRRRLPTPTGTLVILDDVMTTGSTLYALATLARRAGYANVIAATVARTQKTEDDHE